MVQGATALHPGDHVFLRRERKHLNDTPQYLAAVSDGP